MKPRALYQQAKGGTLRCVFALSYPIGVANLSQILLGVGAGLIVLLVLSIGPSSLFAVFGVSEAVRAEGVPYLRVLAFAAILAAATAMFRAVYASMGETSVAMRMTFLVNAINIPLNYVLVLRIVASLGTSVIAGIAFFVARTAGSWWPCRQRNWRVAAI